MKYAIVLITKSGIVTEIYDSTEIDLEQFRSSMILKYGEFFQQSVKELK